MPHRRAWGLTWIVPVLLLDLLLLLVVLATLVVLPHVDRAAAETLDVQRRVVMLVPGAVVFEGSREWLPTAGA